MSGCDAWDQASVINDGLEVGCLVTEVFTVSEGGGPGDFFHALEATASTASSANGIGSLLGLGRVPEVVLNSLPHQFPLK